MFAPRFKVKWVSSRNKERRPAIFESHNKISEVHRDCIKILGEGVATKSPLTNDQLKQIFICQVAHLCYLQDEYATLVVKSRFDPTALQFFDHCSATLLVSTQLPWKTCKLQPQSQANAHDHSQAVDQIEVILQ